MSSGEKRHYFKELRLQQFRSFCEVARRLSFSGVATALGISRPAVWHQIRALEQELGTSLVVRQGRGVALTVDGQLLIELAAPLMAGFDSISSLFQDRRRSLQRHLTVVTTASLLANTLKPAVREFCRQYPQVELTLVDRYSPEAHQLVETGAADLAVASHLVSRASPSKLEFEHLTSLPYLLVCPQGHPLAGRKTLTLRELVRYPMVLPSPGSRSRTHLDRVLQDHHLLEQLKEVMDTPNTYLIPEYVALGLGIAPVVTVVPDHLRRLLHIRSMAALVGEEPVVLLRRKGVYELPHVRAFGAIVRQTLSQSRAS